MRTEGGDVHLSIPSLGTLCKSSEETLASGPLRRFPFQNGPLPEDEPSPAPASPAAPSDFPPSQTSGLGSPCLPACLHSQRSRQALGEGRPAATVQQSASGGHGPQRRPLHLSLRPANGGFHGCGRTSALSGAGRPGAICQQARSHRLAAPVAGRVQLG